MADAACKCGSDECQGVSDNANHQCGGPREACALPGCGECGTPATRRAAASTQATRDEALRLFAQQGAASDWLADIVADADACAAAEARAEAFIGENQRLKTERDAAVHAVKVANRTKSGDVWFWQNSDDRPESLVCPVVMEADTLRAMLSERDRLASDIGKLTGERDRERERADAESDSFDSERRVLDAVKVERDEAREDAADTQRALDNQVLQFNAALARVTVLEAALHQAKRDLDATYAASSDTRVAEVVKFAVNRIDNAIDPWPTALAGSRQ